MLDSWWTESFEKWLSIKGLSYAFTWNSVIGRWRLWDGRCNKKTRAIFISNRRSCIRSLFSFVPCRSFSSIIVLIPFVSTTSLASLSLLSDLRHPDNLFSFFLSVPLESSAHLEDLCFWVLNWITVLWNFIKYLTSPMVLNYMRYSIVEMKMRTSGLNSI